MIPQPTPHSHPALTVNPTGQDVFLAKWAQGSNFRIPGMRFAYRFPEIPTILAALVADDLTKATEGNVTEHRRVGAANELFRDLPLDRLMERTFQCSHYQLERFDVPGGILEGFHEAVLRPWQAWLTANDYTWERCYPIIRVSGRNSVTGYHVDVSNVLFWQVYGCKKFWELANPAQWTPAETVVSAQARKELTMPADLPQSARVCHVMEPGGFLWNALLTPHWVETYDELSFGVNISHGRLRHRGRLCANEEPLVRFWAEQPGERF